MLTPNGKIHKVNNGAFEGCSELASIDLTECEFIGENGFSASRYNSEPMNEITFTKNVVIKKGGLETPITKIRFLCDDASIDNGAFGVYIGKMQIECISNNVYNMLLRVARNAGCDGSNIKLISNN